MPVSGDAADLATAALDAGDLPGFSLSMEQATDYPMPGTGAYTVLASYAAFWSADPANDTGSSDLYLALSLHGSSDDAEAMLTALPRSMGADQDLSGIQELGSQGLGDESMSASFTMQQGADPTQQLFGVAFRRGSVYVLIVGGGSVEQVAAYAAIIDQRLAAAGS